MLLTPRSSLYSEPYSSNTAIFGLRFRLTIFCDLVKVFSTIAPTQFSRHALEEKKRTFLNCFDSLLSLWLKSYKFIMIDELRHIVPAQP